MPDRWLLDERVKPWHDHFVELLLAFDPNHRGVTHKLHDLRHYFVSGLIAAGAPIANDGPRVGDHNVEYVRLPPADNPG